MQKPGLLSVLKLLIRAITTWERQIERQNSLLERIATVIAPIAPETKEEPALIETDDEAEVIEDLRKLAEKYGYDEEVLRQAWEKGTPIP